METDDLFKAAHCLIDDDKPAVTRSIIIGAGSDGIKSLISAKEIIEKKIHPMARRYLRWIAVNSCDPGIGTGVLNPRFPSEQFSGEESRILYLSMTGSRGITKDLLNEKHKNDPHFDWLPDPEIYEMTDLDNPVRALERYSFFLSEDNIRRNLIKERDRLDQLSDEPEYFRLAVREGSAGKKKTRMSVFIITSPECVTGSGIFFDIAALVRDIFRNTRPGPDIYSVLVLPGYGGRDDERTMSRTYAFFKELDYFMSGGRFVSVYPSGRKVEIQDSLFNEGRVYILDPENMDGRLLDEGRHVYDLAGELISAFICGHQGRAFDCARAYDKFNIPLYHCLNGRSARKACYCSFGISRAVYPVRELVEIGYRSFAVKMIESFFLPAGAGILAETLGTMNRGLVRRLNLDCRMIFERMYPGHKTDIANETALIKGKFTSDENNRDAESVAAVMKDLIALYDENGLDRRRHLLISSMERRFRPELERIRNIITAEIPEYILNPGMGFLSAVLIADILRERLDIYIKRYREQRTALAFYSASDLEQFPQEQLKMESCDDGLIDSLSGMASFNYSQFVYECMLASAESFAVELRGMISGLKKSMIAPLYEKASAFKRILLSEIRSIKNSIFSESNPFTRLLVNEAEIDLFVEKYFYSKLSLADLRGGVDLFSFPGLADDPSRVMEAYMISKRGIDALDMDDKEIRHIITEDFGECADKSSAEMIFTLYGDKGGAVDLCRENPEIFNYKIDNMKMNFFRIIHAALKDSDFKAVSIKDILGERRIAPDVLLEQLDAGSRPCVAPDITQSGPVEYYRVAAGFKIDAGDQGQGTLKGNLNDLPPRLKSSVKRKNSEPPVFAEIIEVPFLCGNSEITSTGALVGFSLSGLIKTGELAGAYHVSVSERRHPPHIFCGSSCNALYFPDPSGRLNYLNPVRLWSGLVLLNILEERDGAYHFNESLIPSLKEIEARENYRKVILELYRKIEQQRDSHDISAELLAEVVNGLGILAKNPSDGKLQFRRDYLPVIEDIMHNSEEKGIGKGLSADVPIPGFSTSMELVSFLEGNAEIKSFITAMIKSVIERSIRNVTAGVDISLPSRRIELTELPVFKNKFEFYDYYEKRGSLEWQNVLMTALSEKLDVYISSSKFRHNDGRGLPDRSKISELLKALEQRMPESVLLEADMKNRS